MNKVTNIINNWTYQSNNFDINNILALKLCKSYSNSKKLKLIHLNLIDKIFNTKYWFICKKTGILYLVNLIINNKNYLVDNFIDILSELQYHSFVLINFIVIESVTKTKTNTNTKTKSKSKFKTKYFIFNKYYSVININSITKTLLVLNKSSRNVRYQRRNIITLKRTLETLETLEKQNLPKMKKTYNRMIAATAINNYMINDTIIDYLKEYNIYSIQDKSCFLKPQLNDFNKCIMKEGVLFENELIKFFKTKHLIITCAEHFSDCHKKEYYEKTIYLMKQGTPIIYQAVLHNYTNNTFGMPDLLIRSDYINTFMGYEVIDDKEANTPSPTLGLKYHYKVIDIKHSTIPLKSDNKHILNTGSIPMYKGQLYVYTMALNNILGVNINKAFIMGKKYKYTIKNVVYENNNFLNKLGVCDYDTDDISYVEQTINAIKWIQKVRDEGHTWSLLPKPSINELYPNMKNDMDGIYHMIKTDLANIYHEITQIRDCGIKERELAFANGVYSWFDPKCTAKLLGFTKKASSSIIDNILDINRQEKDLIRPNSISWDRIKWGQTNKDTLDFYLDFETLNTRTIDTNQTITCSINNYIFMIGVGYIKNNKWIFEKFIMKTKTEESEKQMFMEWLDYVNKILKIEKKTIGRMFHWSCAEVICCLSFKNRHPKLNIIDSHISFYDLNKVFVNQPIVVKDALNFSLKSIAKALNKHGYIKSVWNETSPCSNGLTAMVLANNIYDNISLNVDITQESDIKEIIYYNEIDCKVMWEIHDLIKSKY